MSEKQMNRTKWLHLRLKPDEYEKINSRFHKTTCRKLSDFVRRSILEKPIVTTYRNQSLDDAMTQLMMLRTELNSIGNNFNQAVKTLRTLHQIADFKAWLNAYESDKNVLLQTVDDIKNHIEKAGEKWLQ